MSKTSASPTSQASNSTPPDGADRAPLVVRHLGVHYGERAVLQGADFAVPAGRAVALVGPNGAGKSTLLKAVVGLVPPSEGTIELLGTTVAAARSRVAYVPQIDDLDSTFPVSAAEVVLMGRYRHIGWFRRAGRHDRQVAADALERVGLSDRAGSQFGELSGGQRQRVLLARAVAQEAPLLLLDEPFNGVDGTTTSILLDVLHSLTAAGASVVMSTHDLSIARHCCHFTCLLRTEQIAYGPSAEVLTPDLLARAYGEQAFLAQLHSDHRILGD